MNDFKQGITQSPQTGRKKVLYIITKSNFGGAQRYVYDLATNMDVLEWEPVVAYGAAQGKSEPGILADMLIKAGVRTVFLSSLGRSISLRDISVFFDLYKLIKKESPDVVHLNSSKVGGLGALAARLVGLEARLRHGGVVPRIIFTAHGWPFWEERPWIVQKIIFLISYISAILTDTTICISEFDKKALIGLPFMKSKLAVIYNGLSPITFLDPDIARAALFSNDEIESHRDDLWLVSTGELHDNKNYLVALEAVAKYNDTNERKIFYSILGEGEMRAAIAARISELNLNSQVNLCGYIKDARQYLKAFDIFIMPSKKEGVPYAILEAAIAGLPIIASRVGGIPEIIEDGVSGILINSKSAEEFEHAFETIIGSPEIQNSFVSSLKNSVTKKFSLVDMIDETLKIYTK